ncbi:protein-disulfide reductase DsbD [Acinetobacter sp. ANC 4648]|uniref:protein-disulfide reductase DsbD n=1 Tax=Acinetobacter sp. ANC 4648 TaxID=1977875 RepID=UPI00148A8AB2|nr:protein-disulfide reductase DsbD [Acinetobacter sp. ANC 4648]
MRAFLSLCFLSIFTLSSPSFANDDFLAPDQAFKFSAESISEKQAQLKWTIAPHYYLYHDQFKVSVNNTPLKLSLPKGHQKNDPTFGITEVHYNQVLTQINVKPNTSYQVVWQGCAEDGLCYPLQRKTIQTDANGLLPQSSLTSTNLLGNNGKNQFNTDASQQKNVDVKPKIELAPQAHGEAVSSDKVKTDNSTSSTVVSTLQDNSQDEIASSETTQIKSNGTVVNSNALTENNAQNSKTASLQWNDDQSFFKLLSKDSIFLNLIVFFGLGILLAFLPCSLPLIPILSGIILQRTKGYKAVIIALSFVISMALVYSLMGVVVAEIGYSFQRWFQSPIVISLFALLFIVFALNLFGLFQLSMPQALTQKLNSLQDKQKGGTLLGAVIMGALSALIVGPCMSAPLAGALLFVSQSHNAVLGGVYLFVLGLGIGVPLFLTSIFGSKFLPKPGVWMDRLKVCFGFMMLMMAVYFIRPMIPSMLYSILLAILCLALAIYLFFIRRDTIKTLHKGIMILMSVIFLFTSFWNIQQSITAYQVQHSQAEHLRWINVNTAEQLNQALAQAQKLNQPIIMDVYADWCVACQPLEKEVFPRTDVQNALKGFTLIKLNLTEYDASQDIILKEREILGPPTMLFLNSNAQEIRPLRLTGTFSAKELMQQLNKVAQ